MKKIAYAIFVSKYLLVLILGLSFLSLFIPQIVSAATLYYSPAQGSYEVGKSFTVNIYAASADQALNAFTGTVDFPSDLLQVISVSKSGSIASLWMQDPSFSNANGTVTFGGLVLNPGFKGASGKVLSITFKTKAVGTANLRFSAGEILANDGKGTNILQGLGSAQIKVITAAVGPQAPTATSAVSESKVGIPFAPVISSPTHIDPNAWYSNNSPKFTWTMPSGVTAVRVLYDKYPTSDPSVVYQPPISGKDLNDVADGTYYFHAQFKNAQGWGAISHFRFQIDTVAPTAFNVKFLHGNESSDSSPAVLFSTTDDLSGLDYYEVKVGDSPAVKVKPEEVTEAHPYIMSAQKSGQRSIVVRAVDKAGNSVIASELFNILALGAPALDYYSNDLVEGDILKLSGKTYPSSLVTIFIRDESGLTSTDKVTSDAQGVFSAIWSKKLPVGIYSLWVQAVDANGTQSAITTPNAFVVRQSWLNKLVDLALHYLSAIMFFVALALGLLWLAWYGWHKFVVLRKQIKKNAENVDKNFSKIFDNLQKDIEKQIRSIEKAKDKRELTKEEKRVIAILKRELNAAKKVLGEDMKYIGGGK
jgi:hypothetical protein